MSHIKDFLPALAWLVLSMALLAGSNNPVHAAEYNLVIEQKDIVIDGHTVKPLTVNGQLPGSILRWKEGEDVTVHVTNKLNEETSIHWHGILLPGQMDGVPGLNGYQAIQPEQTFTYNFPIRQSGTYWYHSHSGGQEQSGVYGAIVIEPKKPDMIQADRDYVVMLTDFTAEHPDRILANLKVDVGYYNYGKRTVGDFFRDMADQGLGATIRDRLDWGDMRMDATDLADVTGYTFLINGKSTADNWTGLFKAGERVRLRFINGSAMSYYDVRIPGMRMVVVAADGQNVQPVPVDEFRIAVAETYDVIVTPDENKAYAIMAEPIDRSGFVRATLAPQEGMVADIPERRPRAILTMADMGMAHAGMDHSKMAGMDHGSMMGMSAEDHAAMMGKMGDGSMANMTAEEHEKMMAAMIQDEEENSGQPKEKATGWADTGLKGMKGLNYKDLKSLVPQKDTRPEEREIVVHLGGNMERYIWTLNGKKLEDAEPINLRYGERVKLTFINETMMAHPMHLHGMFVQLVNGQPAERLPNKHIVNVPPGQSYSAMLTADEPGEWSFHCHLLYHMASGMMTKAVVAKLSSETMPIQSTKATETSHDHH
jgi:CopA family copper-resistance protein